MRILQLSFANLNALYGHWQIDFTTREFDGIFAITGATGAGKSTLLDAICLALYGRTPRLDKISSGSNEVMSRGTGECHAEVTFLLNGKTYTAHWSQARAYKKSTGKLQNPKHEIAENGKILESQSTKTVKKIETLLGLDFPRFTRTILLAQGQFAAFLNANPAERAEILEKITGTDIYSEISIAVHERQRYEKEALEKLQFELGSFVLKTPEEMATLETERTAAISAVNQAKEQWEYWHHIVKQQENLQQLEETVQQHTQAVKVAEAEKEVFASEKARLTQHRQAEAGKEQYQQLQQLREKLTQAIKTRQEALQGRENVLQMRENAALAVEKLRLEQQKLAEKHQASENIIATARQLELLLPQLLADRDAKHAALTVLEKPIAEDEYFELKPLLEGKTPQFWRDQSLKAEREVQQLEEISKILVNLAQMKEKILTTKEQQITAQQALLAAQQDTQQAETLLQHAEQNSAQQNVICQQARIIASLEEQRARLQPDQPCPLCGATVHPYVNHDRLPSLSESEQDYQHALQREKTARQTFNQAREVMIHAERHLDYLQTTLTALEVEMSAQQNALPAVVEESLPTKLATARDKRGLLQEKVRQIDAALYQQAWKNFVAAEQAVQENRQQWQANGGKSVEQLKATLCNEATQMQQQIEQAEKAFHSQEKAYLIAEHDLLSAQEREKQYSAELAVSEEKFQQFLAHIGLGDESCFQQVLLPVEEAERLEQQAITLEEQWQTGKLRLFDAQEALEKAQAEFPVISVNPRTERENISNHIDLQQQKIGQLQRELNEQYELQTRIGEKRAEISKQDCEFRRWQQLHALIGSADGKKYRNFVQGLTFAALLGHANQQLSKMTKRYLLENDEHETLSLNVIDRYQNDERRTAKNLSGGEGFMVSLALALGLAQMSGQNTPMESLFLDEGFGTLDEEALDNALEMLTSLQESGKLIGIISHVGALKERIATQIHVQAGNHGRSVLKGVGVKSRG